MRLPRLYQERWRCRWKLAVRVAAPPRECWRASLCSPGQDDIFSCFIWTPDVGVGRWSGLRRVGCEGMSSFGVVDWFGRAFVWSTCLEYISGLSFGRKCKATFLDHSSPRASNLPMALLSASINEISPFSAPRQFSLYSGKLRPSFASLPTPDLK